MTHASHKHIFGILSKHMGNEYHVLGAIYKLDDTGKAVDFTPIDFDGKTVRDWWNEKFGMTLPTEHFIQADRAIFFPISDESARLMTEALDEVRAQIRDGRNGFYYRAPSVDVVPGMERRGVQPIDFDGRPRGDVTTSATEFGRDPRSRPRAATNCKDFLFETLTKIAGVPLEEIAGVAPKGSNELQHIPMKGTPVDLRQFIEVLTGNRTPQGETVMAKDRNKEGGRLVELADKRCFYVFDNGDGAISATGALNTTVQHHGQPMPLTQALLQSPVWYQPERHVGMQAEPSTVIHKPFPMDLDTLMKQRLAASLRDAENDLGI